jgi:hypothetical protein
MAMWIRKVSRFTSWKTLVLTATDFAIITTEGDHEPTVDEARNAPHLPINEEALAENNGDGRGSMVWFNQASMFQSSELETSTVKAAVGLGMDGTSDVRDWLRKRVFMSIGDSEEM